MARMSKQKRERLATKRAHKQIRLEYAEALQVSVYLHSKVQSLRTAVAELTQGADVKIAVPGYSLELEAMEQAVLERANVKLSDGSLEIQEDEEVEAIPSPRKRRKPNLVSSSCEAELLDLINTSDGITMKPADLFSSDAVFPSDVTLATEVEPADMPEPESSIDPDLLADQLQNADFVLGELVDCTVAQRILRKAPLLKREHLERMKMVFEVVPASREDVIVFADVMLGG